MNPSAYETTIMKHQLMQKHYQQLNLLRAGGQLHKLVGHEADHPDFTIYVLLEPQDELQAWFQPLVYSDNHGTDIFIDGRMFKKHFAVIDNTAKADGNNDSLNLLIASAVLTGFWNYDAQKLIGISSLPYTVYASTLTDAIGRRVGLDPQSQFKLMVVFQAFYMTRHYKTLSSFSGSEKMNLAVSLARHAGVPADSFIEILETMEDKDLFDLASVVEYIKRQQWSPRLKNFSLRDLYNITAGYWSGQGNPRETVFAALEFPPIWIALCYIISKNTYYQKYGIGQTIKNLNRGNTLKQFIQQVNYVLR